MSPSLSFVDFLPPLAGGALVGLAAALLLLANGRTAGISGITGGLVMPGASVAEHAWRAAFVAGLVAVGALGIWLAPAALPAPAAPIGRLVAAGLLVGVGTRLANGCTSGHGVCGLARRSPRSLAATAAFMAAGMLAVALAGVVS